MRMTDLLRQEAENMYKVTEELFRSVDPNSLDWKPATGTNWMTTGQLLMHCTNACGMCIKGFVSGDWGMPPDMSFEDLPPDAMLPPAEKMPSVSSVQEALDLLAKDKRTAFQYIAEAGEENLLTKKSTAPWGGAEVTLFEHLYHMIGHLGQHKGQLFYYLKLQGKPVNTMHLWGG